MLVLGGGTAMAHHLVDVARLPESELEHLLRYGETPVFGSLDGWRFKGANLVAPGKWLFPRFVKGFHREGSRDMGYNVAALRGPLGSEWAYDPAKPDPFGFYECRVLRAGDPHACYPGSLFLDYGRGGNGLDPAGRLRDYLVQLEAGNQDLYLGKAFFDLGPVWAPGGYFVLERWQKAPAAPPRRV